MNDKIVKSFFIDLSHVREDLFPVIKDVTYYSIENLNNGIKKFLEQYKMIDVELISRDKDALIEIYVKWDEIEPDHHIILEDVYNMDGLVKELNAWRGTYINSTLLCSDCKLFFEDVPYMVKLQNKKILCDTCYYTGYDKYRLVDDKHDHSDCNHKHDNKYTPKAIYDYLSETVIGQEDAKRIMSVVANQHLKRVNNPKLNLAKSNCFMTGGSGVGKTFIAKTLAEYLDVPFTVFDMTGVSAAGYVGCLRVTEEVLTSSGFKKIGDITLDDDVAQFDILTKNIKFAKPLKLHEYDYNGDMIDFKSNIINQSVTTNHKLPLSHLDGSITYDLAENVYYDNKDNKPVICGNAVGDGIEFSNIYRLLIAIQADGSDVLFSNKDIFTRKENDGFYSSRFNLVKPRKIERLINILKSLENDGVTYKFGKPRVTSTGKPYQRITVKIPKNIIGDINLKDFNTWSLLTKSGEFISQFLDETSLWDGRRYSEFEMKYNSTNKDNAETIATLAHLCGRRSNISVSKKYTKWQKNDCYEVRIYNRKKYKQMLSSREVNHFEGKVYCLTVDTGFFVMRNEGIISITGNSDIKDCVKLLLNKAKGDVKTAEKGVIVLDEFSKIASAKDGKRQINKDDVMEAVLAMLEGIDVEVSYGSGYDKKKVVVNTKNILFIATGAFADITHKAYKDKDKKSLGFIESKVENKKHHIITADDIVNQGILPEVMGRFAHVVNLKPLSQKVMREIITKSKDSALTKITSSLTDDGHNLSITSKAVDAIAEKLFKGSQLGARGIQGIIEKLLVDVMFDILSSNDKYNITITTDKDGELKVSKRKIKGE